MFTTSHAMIGFLLARKKKKEDKWFSIIGAVLPDVSVFLTTIILFWNFIFNSWQNTHQIHEKVHAFWLDAFVSPIFHSVFFWLVVGGILFLFYRRAIFLVVGGLSHVFVDFLTHQGKWTWNHLYPLQVEPVEGIINYWSPVFFISVHFFWVFLLVYWYVKRKKLK